MTDHLPEVWLESHYRYVRHKYVTGSMLGSGDNIVNY